MGDVEVVQLRQEVVRLSQELDQTVAEKEQAAQYGLVLLEEKDSLDARCQVSTEPFNLLESGQMYSIYQH